ncbi:DNA recombination protein RmuC [Litorivivens lipolytica]|uniref:DNA recombination protein RmuC n=1 Tax=Litorivivens lipolytica TaxID=1524264 RepID=A0A7W4W395_9GAMM|nr:DNA recombination protein RmuC [Litorivivens lipolytica]MBB3046657.1 DNA recombination protein RmuC [Litorivivens lipolytica]
MTTNTLSLLAGALLLGVLLGYLLGDLRRRRAGEVSIRAIEVDAKAYAVKLEAATAQSERLMKEIAELRQKNLESANENARLSTRLEEQAKTHQEKMQVLEQARDQLTVQFKQLSDSIFEQKQKSFNESSRQTLETLLTPFRDQLKEFRTRVDDIYDRETRDRSTLKEQIAQLQQVNQRMSAEAVNLTRALKGDSKVRGNWGEVILERVLEESGLRKGHEYETQTSFTEHDGRRLQPDVVVRLPDEKDIVIDAKVSLVAYEQYASAEDETERKQALQAHVRSIKQHIDGLSLKSYEHIAGINSLDFVLIFVPIESAFMAAFDADPELFRTAYEKNIIVVSPTTLLATLRTVQSIWRHEHQNRNAEAIASEAGGLHDQFVMMLSSMEDIGKHLDRSREAYEKTLDRISRGRGNLVRRVEKLEKLGAKTKRSLPKNYQADDEFESLPTADD